MSTQAQGSEPAGSTNKASDMRDLSTIKAGDKVSVIGSRWTEKAGNRRVVEATATVARTTPASIWLDSNAIVAWDRGKGTRRGGSSVIHLEIWQDGDEDLARVTTLLDAAEKARVGAKHAMTRGGEAERSAARLRVEAVAKDAEAETMRRTAAASIVDAERMEAEAAAIVVAS